MSLIIIIISLYLCVIILCGLLCCSNVSLIHCAQYNVTVGCLRITMVAIKMQKSVFSLLRCVIFCQQQHIHWKQCHGNTILVHFIIIIKRFYVATDNINFLMSSCKAPDILLCFNHIRIFWTHFHKRTQYQISGKSSPVEAELIHADRRTWTS